MTARFLVLLLVLLPAACGAPADPLRTGASETQPGGPVPGALAPEELIARVDDRVLTRKDIELLDPTNTLTAEEIGVLVQNWIERELLLKMARQRGVDSAPLVRLEIEEQTANIILSALGESLHDEFGNDTAGRIAFEDHLESVREGSRIEAYPWKVR